MAMEQQLELQQLVQQQRERRDVDQHWKKSLRVSMRVSAHIVQNSKRPLRFRTSGQRLRGRWRWTEHTDADDGRRLCVSDVECSWSRTSYVTSRARAGGRKT